MSGDQRLKEIASEFAHAIFYRLSHAYLLRRGLVWEMLYVVQAMRCANSRLRDDCGAVIFSGMAVTQEHPVAKLAEARLKEHVARHLPDARVWLFGSRAKGSSLRRSDFDLAVEPGPSTPKTALFNLETSIREDPEIIYPVDVVDLRTVSATLRANVERDGILWKN